VKSNKNDYRDAEAIAEAVERENMRFVPIKTEDQLDLQALDRVRDRLVARRTSVINQIRAFLLERGISFRKGPADPRSGSLSLDCRRIGHRQRRGFQKGTGVCGLAGTGATAMVNGGKPKLLGISKRGNPYLRKMFIHGARAAVLRGKREGSSLGKWMSGLETRTARNVVIVATANQLARISWAVLASGNDYQPLHKAALLSN
jgi:transposase